ncbi:MAG: FG-GAP-like repeat-containing protein, partial [Bacteroidota bacterium]
MRSQSTMFHVSLALLALLFGLPRLQGQNGVHNTPTSFSVNANGAATFKVPIRVPKGRNGMEPDIWLEYNSNAGDGPFGYGWQIGGIPEITRVQPTIAQDGVMDGIDMDANDRWSLNGERLIATNGPESANMTHYRTENDRFAQITCHGFSTGNPFSFSGRFKDGRRITYGARIVSSLYPGGHASRYRATQVSDRFDNKMLYTYWTQSGTQSSIIKQIRYTYPSDFAEVYFEIENRPSASQISNWHHGGDLRHVYRVKRIVVKSNGVIVRTYTLNYQTVGATSMNRLVRIQEGGKGGITYPPINLTWGNVSEDGTFYILGQFPFSGYAAAANNYKYKQGDFNGDGRMDLVHFVDNNYLHVWLSDGDGTYSIQGAWPQNGYPLGANNYNFEVGDFNADGKEDLIHFRDNNQAVVWLSNGNGTFQIKNGFPNTGYAVGYNNYNYRLGDFNGDGRTDLVHLAHSNGVYVWLSNGDGTFQIKSQFPFN